MNCPAGGLAVGGGMCPTSGASRNGPRGCAFIGYTLDGQQPLYGAPQGPNALAIVYERERKTIAELLLPEAPSSEITKPMTNADGLNPRETDVLAMALGAPVRRVLQHAETLGPRTGWRDGYLSTRHGFCPPDPSASPIALAASPGRVWSDLCARLPGLVSRGKCRGAILGLPLVAGTPDVIPDAALWAAVACLGILASTWRYEERNDGHEGLVTGAAKSAFLNIAGDEDEEPETRGIPRVVVIPLRQICTRLGRPLPYLSMSDASICNFKLRDHTSIEPYPERVENMDLRWPVFQDQEEAMVGELLPLADFNLLIRRKVLLCMADSHGCFTPAIDLIATCQERVMERDNEGLLDALIALKGVVDQLPYVFHKISVNPGSGENFAHPVEWGRRFAKWTAPLSARVPALSGLFLPLFLTMDAFLGRKNFRSFLGAESIHLRTWMPPNIRAFLAAIEHSYSVPEYVRNSGDSRLMGVLGGIVEGYAGERGFMGTHRYKVYGFLEVVAKTGRIGTNGNASTGATDIHSHPWQVVHRTLAASMLERLEPFRRGIPIAAGAASTSIVSNKQTVTPWVSASPHEWRGTFEECRFRARVVARNGIDDDESRSTGRVTIDLRNSGLNFAPGDRLAIMPLNAWKMVEKVARALGLMDTLDEFVPLTAPETETWRAYAKHETEVLHFGTTTRFTVRDILRKGKLAPLTKPMVLAVHTLLRAPTVTRQILASSEWPVQGSLGDLLVAAVNDVPKDVWNRAFDPRDLSWLPALMSLEVPRTYSVSTFSGDGLPDSVDLTVSRAEYRVCQQLVATGAEGTIPGVASGFLNPNPLNDYYIPDAKLTQTPDIDDVSHPTGPLNFQLPISAATPIAMFAGGSGIAPFRSFWQARIASGAIGRNVLFLGVQSRKKFLYKQELRQYVLSGQLELHVAFSRDSNGLVFDPQLRDLVEKQMEPRYIDVTIVDQGSYICDLVTSTKLGGLGGSLYICGSVPLYETVMSGLRRALYKHRAVTKEKADKLLATAFAERRFMLDVFMTPRIMSDDEPVISLSALAQYTGHRDGKMWIGVHGSVYDVTEFLPIHPGGSLIVAASAGLDASVAFGEVAHTSNPEVMSLLGKYFIGRLQPTPSFQLQDLNELRACWVEYLRTCVEGLTTMSFETQSILQDSRIWFQGGLLNIGGVSKFYQFQSRLIQNGFPNLFGTKIHELYFKLTFVLASRADGDLPDVMGTIIRAHSSLASITARKTVAEIGEFVGNGSTAQAFENGIIAYARAAIELDVQLLERVRGEICLGLDAFDRVAEILKSYPGREKQALYKIASVLMKYLERVAERLESYYTDHAALSLYNPIQEANPARARWNILHRRIRDGSFFVFTRQIHFTDDLDDVQTMQPASKTRVARNKRESVTFDQILSQAASLIVASEKCEKIQLENPQLVKKNQGLAAAHTKRAGEAVNASSTYEEQSVYSANKRMSKFMQSRMKDIQRLSHAKSNFSLKHAFAAYGVNSASSRSVGSDSRAGAADYVYTNID
ncbi:Nitrate reductase [NADPH] [Ceratobasidium theobromae]|uniref:NADPH--hemoprotein reductase n=1 Tax=Ceratobasidium theobromae TaxID=1582974 RepID=A0A5N5QC23_9AGAM|nr:Nitrate reductase [NADPH] [Ceratobasidium theobromae]